MNDELSPDCGRVRNELPAFLYGELAPDAHAALEQHLDGCVPCREELNALRETQRLLSRWETPVVSDDPRQLARAIAAQAGARDTTAVVLRPASPRRARLVRWSALVSGAAAALLFSLSLLSARASYEGGRLQLDFSLPGARPAAPAQVVDWQGELPPGLHDEVRAIAAQEVAARSASLEQRQDELLQRFSQMSRQELQQELLRLTQAVDYARAQDRRTFDTQLTTLGREAARADLETREVLTNLVPYLPDPNRSNR